MYGLVVRFVGISVSIGLAASIIRIDEKRMDADTLVSDYETTCHISDDSDRREIM
jgi:hypothetical protein